MADKVFDVTGWTGEHKWMKNGGESHLSSLNRTWRTLWRLEVSVGARLAGGFHLHRLLELSTTTSCLVKLSHKV